MIETKMTAIELYKQMTEATFTDPQARGIVQALQKAGLCEKGEIDVASVKVLPSRPLMAKFEKIIADVQAATIENEWSFELLGKLLEAEPFVPFEIESGKTTLMITSPEQCRFNRFGYPVVKLGDGIKHILFLITRVTAQEPGRPATGL
jgi:hypothetical protein